MTTTGSLYQPLDASSREIRLVTIEAGTQDDIVCTLQAVSLSGDLPCYESVSYCWGDTTSRSRVIVDGQSLAISRNAHGVLKRVRDEFVDRTIWIDAICINQADVAERGHQVACQHFVYHGAVRNIIWLGEEDESVLSALHVMRLILDEARLETNDFNTFFDHVYDEEGHVPTSLSGFTSHFDIDPFLTLLARPWFQRLWVVQEAALARLNIGYCGPHEFSMLDVFRAAAFLYSKRNHLLHDLRSHTGLFNAATVGELADPSHAPGNYRKTDKIKLSSLLRKLQRFETTDPRDHVYGVLGLYRHYLPRRKVPFLLEPDYNKNVIEVLRDGTRFTILDQGSLESLNKVSHWSEEDEGFPSWVPQWHRRFDPSKDTSGLVLFDASLGTPAELVMSRFGGPNTLVVKGFLPDHAGHVVTAISGSYIRLDDAPIFVQEAKAMVEAQQPVKDTYSDISEALSTTLLGNRSLESRPVSKQDLNGLAAFEEYVQTTDALPLPIRALNAFSQMSEPLTWRASRFLSAFWRSCKLRRFFTTSSGRIGIGPPTMREGDFVAILFGGYTPYVLRPEGGQYSLVGECYVHGIMNGEAVERYRDESRLAMTFHIN